MPRVRVQRVGRGGIFFLLLATAFSAAAADVLFPQERHFVRRIDDPILGTVTTLHEYCAGNQVVTVHGQSTVIADYGKQELIEIDRAAGTYSVTRFDELARAQQQYARTQESDVRVTVRVDESVMLSRNAVEVLIGAAYPNRRRKEHDRVLAAARRENRGGISAQAEAHALPVEQLFEHEGVTIRNTIVSIDGVRVPRDAVLIPPGARLVESRTTRLARELRDLDELPQ